MSLLITLFAFVSTVVAFDCNNATTTPPSLVLWAYNSLFSGDGTPYDFVSAFEQSASLKNGSTQLCSMSSQELIPFYTNRPIGLPAPDIIIGLDNILENTINDTNLITFDTPNDKDLVPLVGTLGHFEHMKPFDWGMIAIVFNQTLVPQLSAADDARTFNLQWFLQSGLVSHLVAIDPAKDTAGLGFLMWTIAELGDANQTATGRQAYPGGWQAWWREAFQQGIIIKKSWTDAFNEFISPFTETLMMTSYGASPAYDWCNYQDQSSRSVVSWYNNSRVGWAQVEGYVLLNDTSLTRSFASFFTSTQVQDQIALHQFMNPVNKNANIEQCYTEKSIQPQNVSLLNTVPIAQRDITTPNMRSGTWLNTWKDLFIKYYVPRNTTVTPNTTTTSSSGSSSSSSSSSTGGSSPNKPGVAIQHTPLLLVAIITLIVSVVAIM